MRCAAPIERSLLMLYSPHCACQSRTVSDLLKYIRITHASDPDIVFRCDLQGCKRSFKKFKVFQNHIYTFHGTGSLIDQEMQQVTDAPVHTTDALHTDTPTVDLSRDSDLHQAGSSELQVSVSPEMELKRAAAITILKTRELHRIPLSVMDEIIFDSQSLFAFAISKIRNRVCHELVSAGVSSSVVSSGTEHLQETSPLANLYGGLTTQHQQTRYFQDNFRMVVSDL